LFNVYKYIIDLETNQIYYTLSGVGVGSGVGSGVGVGVGSQGNGNTINGGLTIRFN
jgi:hypothetical protein